LIEPATVAKIQLNLSLILLIVGGAQGKPHRRIHAENPRDRSMSKAPFNAFMVKVGATLFRPVRG